MTIKALLTTTFGPITVELYDEHAPETVANFVQYVKAGHYDGTIFHRVIGNFMIQGGGFESGMEQKPTRGPVQNEAERALAGGLKNEPYTLAMARTSNPHSATAQFFINVAANDFLDWRDNSAQNFGYCVFGRVVAGNEVVDQIKRVKTTMAAGHRDVPIEDVAIVKAEIIDEATA